MKNKKTFFVTGTDTGVGKTIATLVLAILFKDKKFNVGVMKPVQCGGDDADDGRTSAAVGNLSGN